MKVSAKRIEGLKGRRRYRAGTMPGLPLQITGDGVKSWILRYMRQGRERSMGLGPLHTVDLELARELARSARLEIRAGRDPIDTRQEQLALKAPTQPMTFRMAAESYYTAHEREWTNEVHRAQFLSSLARYAYPAIGTLAINLIDKPRVLGVLEPIWHTKTETATRVRQRMEKVVGWAISRNLHPGPNPCIWKNNLEFDLAKPTKITPIKHYPSMPFTQVADFVSELRKREGVAARALEFTILTASRTGETIGAQWPEIDFEARTWRIPKERMKMRQPHNVPLVERAIELLSSL